MQISYQILFRVVCKVQQILRALLQKVLPVQIILAIYEYTVTGTGITTDGAVAPSTTTVTGTTSGQSYNYTGLDLSNTNKPQFTLVNPTSGNSFQYTETYRGPGGISNITSITRQISTESVTSTTSVFSQ